MFIELSGSGSLIAYIVNPVNKIDRIYLLFDTVYLLKCIRNNCINETDKTFVYPDFHDNSLLKLAPILSDYFILHGKGTL